MSPPSNASKATKWPIIGQSHPTTFPQRLSTMQIECLNLSKYLEENPQKKSAPTGVVQALIRVYLDLADAYEGSSHQRVLEKLSQIEGSVVKLQPTSTASATPSALSSAVSKQLSKIRQTLPSYRQQPPTALRITIPIDDALA